MAFTLQVFFQFITKSQLFYIEKKLTVKSLSCLEIKYSDFDKIRMQINIY